MPMRPTPFGSVLTAMLTPFDANGEVNYEAAWELARYLVDTGSEGIVVCGTTGESPTLSDLEKIALFKTVLESVGDKAHVIAGTGTYDTAHSASMSRKAADLGCHGLMAVTPYYSKPPQAGLVAHFSSIADATDLPVLLYNIPGRTTRLIEIPTLKELADHPNIVAVKDAVDDLEFTKTELVTLPDDFGVYAGSDAFTYDIVSMGGSGVVSVAAHLVGNQISKMIDAIRSDDGATAERLHLAMMPLFDALFLEPNPMPLKAALGRVWKDVGRPRLPLVPADESVTLQVLEALGEAQLA